MNTASSSGKVLAVDDSPEFVELMAEDLIGQGYEVETAGSGQEALQIAKAYNPDVILLDIQMSGMDGFQTCFALKSDPVTEAIPVIFLTGHNAEEGSAMAAIAAGGSDFIAKPYSPSILFSRVAAQITTSRRMRELCAHPMRDSMTGHYSCEALKDVISREQARAERFGDDTPLTLVGASVAEQPGDWNHQEAMTTLGTKLEQLALAPGLVARIDRCAMAALCFGATIDDVADAASALGAKATEVVSARSTPADALVTELLAKL